jgi:hypothetical protein
MTSNDSPRVQALFAFVQKTPMQYGYKMLLLLMMLQAEGGCFSLEDTVEVFDRFYRRRKELGLPLEKQRGNKQAQLVRKYLPGTIKNGPAPRFQGFLSLSKQGSFEIQPDLWKEMTSTDLAELRDLAIQRLSKHFGDKKPVIEALVAYAFEYTKNEDHGKRIKP